MRINSILAAGAAVALLITPATAVAGGPKTDDHPGKGQAKREARAETKAQANSPAAPNSQAKAYGKYCQGQSKKHVKGQKGTPFSRCVVAMAQLAKNKAKTPKVACKGLSKKHVKGKKGTAFSRCVKAGRKLENDLDRRDGGDETYADPFGDDS
jgi:hypothetical protein